jgi:hypothetical protein
MKFYINNLAELFSLVVAIIYYPYLKRTVMKWFLPFLAFVFVGEMYVNYISVIIGNTLAINNFIAIGESVFYGYFFYSLSRYRWAKKIIVILTVISVLSSLASLAFVYSNPSFLYFNLIFLALVLSVVSLIYLYSKFSTDENGVYLLSESGFWVAFGVALFFSGVSVVFSLHDLSLRYNLRLFGVRLHNIVPQILSVLLYLSLSTAIILCKKKTRISL